MSPDERRRALLALVAAQLEDHRASQAIKRSMICYGRHSATTVRRIFGQKDHRLSSLVDVADDLNLDVEIRFVRRSA